jgi:hypothetical protein
MKSTKFKNFDKAEYQIKLRKPRKELQCEGICDYPEQSKTNNILVNPHQEPHKVLETVIHEMIHAYIWDLSETKVTRLARSIARILVDLGVEIKFKK